MGGATASAMPSVPHQVLVHLFHNRPELAPELLRQALGVKLPRYSRVEAPTADLSSVVPAEYRADHLVLLRRGVRPVFAAVVEVQLEPDRRKRRSWPVYLATTHARFGCPVCLLVVTPKRSVARWASQPIELGPGSVVRARVHGPDAVPIVTEPARARQMPELAVLSAMAHGRSEDPRLAARIGDAALLACPGLDEERGVLYWDVVLSSLSGAARKALLAMRPEGYEFQSDFARRHRAEGRTEGRAEGRSESKAEAVLEVLAARGFVVTEELRHRVLGCTDLELLRKWVRRAATVREARELFED